MGQEKLYHCCIPVNIRRTISINAISQKNVLTVLAHMNRIKKWQNRNGKEQSKATRQAGRPISAERANKMKPPYRVQEYVSDMGVYHKHGIIDGISNKEYNDKNVYINSFYIILPSDDCFGEKLPQIIRSHQERTALCRKHENICRE